MPLFVCGFEAGDTTYYTNLGWSFTGVRTGIVSDRLHQSLSGDGSQYALEVEDSAGSPQFPSGGRWLHFWVAPQSDRRNWPSTNMGVYFYEPGTSTVNASVFFLPGGEIQIRRGTVTVLASSTTYFKTSRAYWVAIEMSALNSGTCNVYMNGELLVSFSGDLKNGSTDGWESLAWAGGNHFISIDDVIVTTAAEGRLEECYVVATAPNGDDTVALTRSTGSTNYETVDEIPPSTADYNEATATAEDFYDMTSLPFTPSRVVAMGHSSHVARDGTLTTGQQGVKSGATTDRRSTVTLGAAGIYETIQAIWATDPNTSTAVVAVDTGADTVSIAGDLTSTIAVGSWIEITGSTGNDGTYVVESLVFSSPNTVITVTGDIGDATADGNVTYNWTETTANALKTGIKFA